MNILHLKQQSIIACNLIRTVSHREADGPATGAAEGPAMGAAEGPATGAATGPAVGAAAGSAAESATGPAASGKVLRAGAIPAR